MKRIYILGVILIGFTSCTNEVKQETVEQKPIVQEKTVEKKALFQVEEDNFLGIKPNDLLSDHEEALQKGKIRDGEKILEVYNIEINGDELGYLLPHSDDNTLVGNIVLQSYKIEMNNGIKVGIPLVVLKEKYANLTIEPSEKEGDFYAQVEDFRFRLRYKNASAKEVNPNEATISEIIILEK